MAWSEKYLEAVDNSVSKMFKQWWSPCHASKCSGEDNRNIITSSSRHLKSVTSHTLVPSRVNRWGNWVPSRISLTQWTNLDSVYSYSSWHNINVVADITMHKLLHRIHGSLRLTICITDYVAHSERTYLLRGLSLWNLLHGQEKWAYNELIFSGKMKCRMIKISKQASECRVQVLLSQWRQRREYFSLYKS